MDNFFKACPPKMSDGRHLTDYRTATRREEYVKNINNIVRDDEYRMFLQKNSNDIANNEWKYNIENKTCWVNECIHVYPTRVTPQMMVEEKQKHDSKTNQNKCAPQMDYRMLNTNNSK